MSTKIVIHALLLVLLVVPSLVSAANAPGEEISQANKFLAAETARQIDDMQGEITRELQEYQDENFQLLDARMVGLMEDTKWKILLATLGAVLVGSGIVAFFLIKSVQNYSYEKYQEKLLKSKGVDAGVVVAEQNDQGYYDEGMEQMQQQAWNPQQSNPSVSTEFGQQAASAMTQMNQWQMQPAYGGSWQSPERPVPEMSNIPGGYEYAEQQKLQQQAQQKYDDQQEWNEDPMSSPNWQPQR